MRSPESEIIRVRPQNGGILLTTEIPRDTQEEIYPSTEFAIAIKKREKLIQAAGIGVCTAAGLGIAGLGGNYLFFGIAERDAVKLTTLLPIVGSGITLTYIALSFMDGIRFTQRQIDKLRGK